MGINKEQKYFLNTAFERLLRIAGLDNGLDFSFVEDVVDDKVSKAGDTMTGALKSQSASGINAIEFANSGARLKLGNGTNDYLYSNGTNIISPGKITFDATDSSATPGAVTINKPSGQVSIAAANNSVIVTNSLVTTSSVVYAVIQATGTGITSLPAVVPANGSFTIYGNANATAATKIGFVVFN